MSPAQQNRLSGFATGTTVAGISQKALRSVPITIPPFADQVMIGKVAGALDVCRAERKSATGAAA
jgi:restriction endonuclease S subunit